MSEKVGTYYDGTRGCTHCGGDEAPGWDRDTIVGLADALEDMGWGHNHGGYSRHARQLRALLAEIGHLHSIIKERANG